MRGAARIPKSRVLDSQSPISQHPAMETPASSFKLRADAPKGRKRFPIKSRRRVSLILPLVVAMLVAGSASAGTIVNFNTSVASFDVELYDTTMPTTVANFLSYVNAGSYTSSIIHRSTTYNPSDIQIVQGGGYYVSANQLLPIPTSAPIILESGSVGNVRGTIAMARGAATDSATSQFFFNLQSNAALDGNYAVFGNVVGTGGLAALDAIGARCRCTTAPRNSGQRLANSRSPHRPWMSPVSSWSTAWRSFRSHRRSYLPPPAWLPWHSPAARSTGCQPVPAPHPAT